VGSHKRRRATLRESGGKTTVQPEAAFPPFLALGFLLNPLKKEKLGQFGDFPG